MCPKDQCRCCIICTVLIVVALAAAGLALYFNFTLLSNQNDKNSGPIEINFANVTNSSAEAPDSITITDVPTQPEKLEGISETGTATENLEEIQPEPQSQKFYSPQHHSEAKSVPWVAALAVLVVAAVMASGIALLVRRNKFKQLNIYESVETAESYDL